MPDTPINTGEIEWTHYRFRDLMANELFWLNTTISDFNSPHRKVDDNSALHLREQKVVNINLNAFVYQKEQ